MKVEMLTSHIVLNMNSSVEKTSIAAAIFFQSENYTLPEEVKFSASSVTSIGQCRLK